MYIFSISKTSIYLFFFFHFLGGLLFRAHKGNGYTSRAGAMLCLTDARVNKIANTNFLKISVAFKGYITQRLKAALCRALRLEFAPGASPWSPQVPKFRIRFWYQDHNIKVYRPWEDVSGYAQQTPPAENVVWFVGCTLYYESYCSRVFMRSSVILCVYDHKQNV